MALSLGMLYLLRVFADSMMPIWGVYQPHWWAVLPDEFGLQWDVYRPILAYVIPIWVIKATYTAVRWARTP